MERTQRVAKLEALLARVQSRSAAGHPGRSSAAAAVSVVPSAAPVARPQLAAVPSPSPSPRPAPVTGGALLATNPGAVTARATDVAAATSDDAPTAIHTVDVAAAMESAAATSAVETTAKPAAAPAPAPAPAPAFRGVSALGALSKKATLIGTAPPANWPPRGAEPAAESPKAAAPAEPAPTPAEPPPPEPAPEIQASEGGDVDALIGGEEAEAPAPRSEPKLVASPMPTPEPVRVSTPPVRADAEPVEPVIEKPVKKVRSAGTTVAFILLWAVILAGIYYAVRGSL